VVRKLYQQIEEKYKDGHKLQHLLESHQNALCKEPRDHVYGFVGLASDCFDGFPIDYQKSLYEVWKDTVMHRRGDREEYRHNMIKFGCLTRRLLGGPDIALPGEVARDLNLRMALVPPKRDSLHFTTRLVGNISALGPTHNEVIAVLKKTAEWKSIIHRHTNEENVPAALEESDMFLEVLEHVGDAALEAIAPFDLETLWKGTEMAEVEPDVKVFDGKAYWGTEENRAQGEIPNLVNIPEGRQLFLLNIRRREPGYPGGMGLGPPNTQVGDYILQMDGVQQALVVRRQAGRVKVVGMAILAEGTQDGRRLRAEDAEHGVMFGTPRFTFHPHLRDAEEVEVVLDVAIMYHLLVR
jgi:hypothetical protein